MRIATRLDARNVVRSVLAADLACDERALAEDGVVVVPIEDRDGRRRFPLREKPLLIATMGSGVVVSCDPERVAVLRVMLGELSRDEVFSATTLARLAHYVQSDGQQIVGPILRPVCTAADLCPVELPDAVEIAVLDERELPQLYRAPGFGNALGYRINTQRPDVLATVATRAGTIVGVAGASADCDRLWQIGVDVVASARGRGIGRALVARLTQEALERGRLPYYSTLVSNVQSPALATAAGYWPCWVEIGVR